MTQLVELTELRSLAISDTASTEQGLRHLLGAPNSRKIGGENLRASDLAI